MLERLAPGTRIGDLEIERELGVGAFGRVYVAHDSLIGRRVAVKVIQATRESAEAEGRSVVLREARAVGKLNSPHIVTLYRIHTPENGGPWMFEMEYVEGGSLADQLRGDQALPPERARAIAMGIASALQCAHDAHVVHGDVKMGNVLLAGDGTPKLADFGLARALGDQSLSFTSTAELAGTPVYMAPEVVMGERPTAASDIWSLGVVLYRTLAGRAPFRGRQLPTLFYAIQQADPLPLQEDLPGDLVALALHCLAKQPKDRPRSCADILAFLRSDGSAPEGLAPPRPPPRATELVGREREQAQISELLTGAIEGRGAALLVTGVTGIGKSALAQQTHAVARRGGFRWVEARVSALRGLMRPLLEATRGLVEEEGVEPADSQLFGSAADIVGKLLAEESTLRLESRAQALWALENLITGLARQPPLAVLLEDAHNADEEETQVLRHLVRTLPPAGVFVMLTARTSGPGATDSAVVRAVAAIDNVVHLPLETLSREDAYRLIQTWAETPHIAAEVSQRVLEVTQGNPLFIVELLKHLERSHSIDTVRGILRPSPIWEQTSLPHRFHELAASYLADLSEEDRALVDVAAVDGVSFDGEAVAAVVGESLLSVLRRLQRLYRTTGLIVPGETGYRFATAIFQEVIYNDLAPELRRRIHLDLARHLASRPADAGVAPERVGAHWENAGRAAEATPYLLKAARRAADRQESQRAIDLAARGGVTPDRVDPAVALEHTELILSLADSYYGSGKVDEAEKLLDHLVRAAEEKGDDTLRLRGLVGKAFIRSRTTGAGGVDTDAISHAAEQLPLCKEKGKARYLLGDIATSRGELEKAEGLLREADLVFRELGVESMHSSTLNALATVASRGGRLEQAESLYLEAARISDRAGRKPNALASRANAAVAAMRAGRVDGVDARLERLTTELAVHGGRRLLGHVLVFLGQARYALGDLPGAYCAVNEALTVMKEINYVHGLLSAHHRMALVCLATGALSEAETHLSAARELAEKEGSPEHVLRALLLQAESAVWRGDISLATALVRRTRKHAQAGVRVAGDAALCFVEAVFFGLPADHLDEFLSRTVRDNHPVEPEAAIARSLAPAILAFADVDSDDAAALRAGSDLLRSDSIGDQRATLRVLAGCLAAEATRREGDSQEAVRILEATLEDATDFGHVWLRALLLRTLTRLAPDGGYRRKLLDHLNSLVPGLGIKDDFSAFFGFWQPA